MFGKEKNLFDSIISRDILESAILTLQRMILLQYKNIFFLLVQKWI